MIFIGFPAVGEYESISSGENREEEGVAIGIAGSIVLTLIIWSFRWVHPYFYLAISILLCIVIGYLASLLFPPPQRSLKGLTIYRDAE